MNKEECTIEIDIEVDCIDPRDVEDALEDWLGDNSAIRVVRWHRVR